MRSLRLTALDVMKRFADEGQGEVPPGSNLGHFVAMVLHPAGLEPPNPYCAATMSYAFYEAAKVVGVAMPFEYTAGALNLARELIAKKYAVDARDVQPGDVLVWRRGKPGLGLGHTGIVEFGANNGRIQTIEANRANTVQHFHWEDGDWQHNLVGAFRVAG